MGSLVKLNFYINCYDHIFILGDVVGLGDVDSESLDASLLDQGFSQTLNIENIQEVLGDGIKELSFDMMVVVTALPMEGYRGENALVFFFF